MAYPAYLPLVLGITFCVTDLAQARKPHKTCELNADCSDKEYCVAHNGNKFCQPCEECSHFNRFHGTESCPTSGYDCGACFDGYAADDWAHDQKSEKCGILFLTSTSPPTPTTLVSPQPQAMPNVWILVVGGAFGSLLLLAMFWGLWHVYKKFVKNPPNYTDVQSPPPYGAHRSEPQPDVVQEQSTTAEIPLPSQCGHTAAETTRLLEKSAQMGSGARTDQGRHQQSTVWCQPIYERPESQCKNQHNNDDDDDDGDDALDYQRQLPYNEEDSRDSLASNATVQATYPLSIATPSAPCLSDIPECEEAQAEVSRRHDDEEDASQPPQRPEEISQPRSFSIGTPDSALATSNSSLDSQVPPSHNEVRDSGIELQLQQASARVAYRPVPAVASCPDQTTLSSRRAPREQNNNNVSPGSSNNPAAKRPRLETVLQSTQ